MDSTSENEQIAHSLTIKLQPRPHKIVAYYADILVEKTEIVALVDTGAVVTMSHRSLLDRCPELNRSICKSTLPGIICIGGNITPVIGEIYVKI